MKHMIVAAGDDDPRWRQIHEICRRIATTSPRDPLWLEAVEKAEIRLYDKLRRDVLPGSGTRYAAAVELPRFAREVVRGEYSYLRKKRFEAEVLPDGSRRPRLNHPLNAKSLDEAVCAELDVELQALEGVALTEALAHLVHALARTTDEVQDIVLLRLFAELDFRDVGALVGKSDTATRQAYGRFCKRL
ncbi:hypothetical protein [Baekduia sp. Peel2402]|uniref:hypothetical protein n=1 Tax=Baekduia sp. Peel2402 TaxID=3458296 RepID=UPI00403E4C30